MNMLETTWKVNCTGKKEKENMRALNWEGWSYGKKIGREFKRKKEEEKEIPQTNLAFFTVSLRTPPYFQEPDC